MLAECGRGGGGGPQGTAGKLPERPWDRKGNLGGCPEAFTLASFEVIVVDLDRAEDVSFASSSWTSSNDEVESRRVVSNGEFDGGSLDAGDMVSISGGFAPATVAVSIVSERVEKRGVEVEEEERGRSVRDRVDADDLDGCEVMSGASSNVSPSRSELSALDSLRSLSAIFHSFTVARLTMVSLGCCQWLSLQKKGKELGPESRVLQILCQKNV